MEKPTIICGVQQVGVGIKDVVEAYNWYIKAFGVDILVADALGVAERMLPYTGGKPRPRRAVLAANLKGGGGLEVWHRNLLTCPCLTLQLRLRERLLSDTP